MERELFKYKKYSHNVRTFLAVSGLWPESNPILSRSLSSIALVTNMVVALTVCNFCIHHSSDIMIVTRAMGMFISMITSSLKISLFLLHRKDIAFLHRNLSKQYTEDLSDPKNRSRLLIRISRFSSIYYFVIYATYLTITMYIVIPIFAWRKYGKYLRMLPSIYPFSYEPGGLVHWLIYAMEVVAALFLGSITTGVDCSFGMFSMQICGELRLLSKKFKELKVGENYKKNIMDCIERHHLICNAKDRLESTFGLLTIWIAISAATALCTLIFQFTEAIKVRSTGLHLVLVTMYIVSKFLQVFCYAWYGEIITEESDLCLYSIYDSTWPDSFNSNFRKDVIFVLRQRPLILKAKGCLYIGLNMFSKIVNTTVSYFFLLQTLSEES